MKDKKQNWSRNERNWIVNEMKQQTRTEQE